MRGNGTKLCLMDNLLMFPSLCLATFFYSEVACEDVKRMGSRRLFGFSHVFGARFSRQSQEEGGFTANTLAGTKTIPPAAHATLKRPLFSRRTIHITGVLPVPN